MCLKLPTKYRALSYPLRSLKISLILANNFYENEFINSEVYDLVLNTCVDF